MMMMFTYQMEQGFNPSRSQQKGFSLLEVLLSIVLLVVGMTALLQVFSIGIFADADVENKTTALYLAQEKMEEIRDASLYADIDTFASSRANLSGDFADFDREVTVSGEPKQVNVVTYWDVKGTDQRVELVSVFSDYDFE